MMADRETVPALVFGQGLTLLGVIRCLGRAGIPALVCTKVDPLPRSSRYFRPVGEQGDSDLTYTQLPRFLNEISLERAVLFPCSDPWARAAGDLPASLRSRFPTVVAPPPVITTLIDKGLFRRLLEQLNVPHPQTFDVTGPSDLVLVPDSRLQGGFLKPRDSVAFFRKFGVKAFDFSGRAQATELLKLTQAGKLEMMIQDYIPGGPDRHYFIDGVAGQSGQFLQLFARRRLRIYPPRFGNSSSMTSVSLNEVTDAIQSLRTLAIAGAIYGIFSAEFKLDQRDGRFKLLEVNSRPWWYIEYAAKCGADVCVPAYRDALGLDPLPPQPYRTGVRCAFPHYDWHAWKAMDRSERCSLASLFGFWLGANQPVLQADDPMPVVLDTIRLIRDRGRRLITQRRAD